MMAVKVAVIGVGQIGSRHIQALFRMNRAVCIQAVDPSEKALNAAQIRVMNSYTPNNNVRSIEFFPNTAQLDDEIDVAIIATNADVRKSVIERLLAIKKVKNIILEKVLFQDSASFRSIATLLKAYNVRTWVNCPIRTNPFFAQFKQSLQQAEFIYYNVTGSNLGIACNSIHHVDLFSYLTEESEFSFTTEYLDRTIHPSKRNGFVEFTGTLCGTTENDHQFRFTSLRNGHMPLVINVSTPNQIAIIRLLDGMAWSAKLEEHWTWKPQSFLNLPQSRLTHHYIEEILETGTCALPTYEHSWKLHIPLLHALTTHYNQITGEDHRRCPIT